MSGDLVVRMAAGWMVDVEGLVVGSGECLELDADTAAHWIARGWAEPALDEHAAEPAAIQAGQT